MVRNETIKWCIYQGMLAIIVKFDKVNGKVNGTARIIYRRSGGGGSWVCVKQMARLVNLQPVGNLRYYKEELRGWLLNEYKKIKWGDRAA